MSRPAPFPPLFACLALFLIPPGASANDAGILPRTTRLPIYWLPHTAAADGNLSEWAGVPASVEPGRFKHFDSDRTIAANHNFAPHLYIGRKRNSDDLMLLVVVKDDRTSSREANGWYYGDGVDLYLDLRRESRDRDNPDWFNDEKQWEKKPDKPADKGAKDLKDGHKDLEESTARFGFLPHQLSRGPGHYRVQKSGKWKVDCNTAAIEGGGVAYEIHIDGKSILDDLKLQKLPDTIGFDLGLSDADYPLILEATGWTNSGGSYRLFGDFTNAVMPNRYGAIDTRGVEPGAGGGDAPPVNTLASLYDPSCSPEGLRAAIEAGEKHLEPAQLADLVYHAGLRGVKLDAATVEKLMSTGDPRVREATLAVLCLTNQDQAAAARAVAMQYENPNALTPQGLCYANLLNGRYGFGHRDHLLQMVKSDDLTVAATAASALTVVADARRDLEAVRRAYEGRLAAAKDQGERMAVGLFVQPAVDQLAFRATVKEPQAYAVRKVEPRNTDLHRLMPNDGNNVYNGKGLARSWTKEGPKELWRLEVDKGYSAVVESAGRAYTMVRTEEDGQVALCLDAATGKELWRQVVADAPGDHCAVTPVIDGEGDEWRVYFVPENSGVVCLRATDGEEVWRNEELRGATFSVPLIHGDTLYLPSNGHALVAVDKAAGKEKWKARGADGKDVSANASPNSPIYMVVDNVPQIVIGVGGGQDAQAWGVSAETGEVFWKHPVPADWGLCASPVAAGSKVLLTTGQGGSGDQFVCLQMTVENGRIGAAPLYTRTDAQTNFANTVAVADGAVYGFGHGGLDCTDLSSGRVLWRESGRNFRHDDQLICADGLLFIVSRSGEIVLADAAKDGYRELGRAKIGVGLGPQQPTIANGRLYVRGEKHVVCYDVGGGAETIAADDEGDATQASFTSGPEDGEKRRAD